MSFPVFSQAQISSTVGVAPLDMWPDASVTRTVTVGDWYIVHAFPYGVVRLRFVMGVCV